MAHQLREMLASSRQTISRRLSRVRSPSKAGREERETGVPRVDASVERMADVAGAVRRLLPGSGLAAEVWGEETGVCLLISVADMDKVDAAFAKADLSSSDVVRINSLRGSARVQQRVTAVLRTTHVSPDLACALHACAAAGDGDFDGEDKTMSVESLMGLPLMGALDSVGLLDRLTPLHDENERDALLSQWGSLSLLASTEPIPLDAIHGYFGSEIALYFAWLRTYTVYLLVPAVLGIVVALHQAWVGSLAVWSLIPYGVMLSLWSSLFLQMWSRKQATIVHEWMDGELALPAVRWEHRPGFRGHWVRHKASGMYILVYPSILRYAKYAVSGFVLFIFIAAVAGNIWGVQELTRSLKSEYPECFDWKHLGNKLLKAAPTGLGNAAEEEEESDLTSGLGTCQMVRILPGVVSALAIQVLAKGYEMVARRMNEWENYASESSARNHLLAKLVLFALTNHFAALFYLAFWVRDWDRLNQRLWVVLVVSQILDNVKELVLPRVITVMRTVLYAPPEAQDAPQTELPPEVAQSRRPTYDDTFDDFLEMCVQFGYISLFGAAFPLAAALALLNNLAEMRVDAFKLCSPSGYARPAARAADGIGVWLPLLDIISAAGVLTNVALLVVTTNSIDEWSTTLSLPQRLGISAFAIKLFIVFVAEHLLVALKLVLRFVVPNIPSHVSWAQVIAETPPQFVEESHGRFARSMVRSRASARAERVRERVGVTVERSESGAT